MFLEDPVLKEYIINNIVREVNQKGFNIEKVYVDSFIDNFLDEYERLPKKGEINPIVSSYIKMIEESAPIIEISQNSGEIDSNNNMIEPVIKSFIQKKNIIYSIKSKGLFCRSGEMLTIKIYETIDRTDIICDYPKIYGKKYTCSGCGTVWKEK
jgi:predicted transcriptional regulator